MTNKEQRLDRVEQAAPDKRVFIGWKGRPWTQKEKEEAVRLRPDGRIFLMPLLQAIAGRAPEGGGAPRREGLRACDTAATAATACADGACAVPAAK